LTPTSPTENAKLIHQQDAHHEASGNIAERVKSLQSGDSAGVIKTPLKPSEIMAQKTPICQAPTTMPTDGDTPTESIKDRIKRLSTSGGVDGRNCCDNFKSKLFSTILFLYLLYGLYQ
jgi:hypothetical protein